MSADPIYSGLKEGLSIYGYCRNNPLIYHDPTGLEEESSKSLDKMLKEPVDLGKIKKEDPEAWEQISDLFTGMPNSSVEEVAKYIEAARTNYEYNQKINRTSITMADIIYGLQWDADRPDQLTQALICLSIIGCFLGSYAIAQGLSTLATAYTSSTAGLGTVALNRALQSIQRLQHASRHLIQSGVLPNWSRNTAQLARQLYANILLNPTKTFDHVLRGGEAVKGYYSIVNGQDIVVFIYKTGQYAGEIATSIIPSAQQMLNWGL